MQKHKSPMYECTAFFPDGQHPKRWKYVKDLKSFTAFLSKTHSSWKYFNVYEKGSKNYLKRFYPGNLVPKILGLLLIYLTLKCTPSNSRALAYPYENTSRAAAGTASTSINDFNNRATSLTHTKSQSL